MGCRNHFLTLILVATFVIVAYGQREHSFHNGTYIVQTYYNAGARTIDFSITVKTLGWVGIGVGPNPNMTGADIVVGGVRDNNNTAYYTDMHATTNTRPLNDTKAVSDWGLVSSSQNTTANVTRLTYRRPINTTDPNIGQDYEIKANAKHIFVKNEDLYLIYAYGLNDQFEHHSNRNGAVKVNLFQNELPTTTVSTLPTTTPSSGLGITEHSFGNGAYYVMTKANTNAGTIEFQATVKTLGWVGIGVGPNPNMNGADIVIGGVFDNNTAYYTDMFATANWEPTPDTKAVSDWVLVSSSQNTTANVTNLVYSRLLKTSDANANQDYEIKNADLYLICAYGLRDTLKYHSLDRRWAVKVNLLQGVPTTTLLPTSTPSSAGIPYSFAMLFTVFLPAITINIF